MEQIRQQFLKNVEQASKRKVKKLRKEGFTDPEILLDKALEKARKQKTFRYAMNHLNITWEMIELVVSEVIQKEGGK